MMILESNMKEAVFDIEANGFLHNVTKVFCIAVKDLETGDNKLFEPWEIENALDYLQSFDTLVGHNICGYDLPVLKKLYGWQFKGELVDTLVLARLEYPFALSNSLKAWGEKLGCAKIDYNNFEYYEPEMGEYCQQDVEVNAKLYTILTRTIDPYQDYIKLEQDIVDIQTRAEQYGVTFDSEQAMKLSMQIGSEMDAIKKQAEEVLGNHIDYYVTNLKKDGTPNVHAQKRIDLGMEYKLTKTKCWIKVETPITFDTKKLLIDRLLVLGWKPEWFTDKGSPQVGRQGEPEPNLANIPGMKGIDIGKYFVLKHRKALIDGLFKHIREDGKIPSEANTLGAVTGRYTHRKIANLPAVRSLYGKEIRALFGVDKGRVQVGCDLAGIEARMLAHYMDDPDYTNEVLNGDIHTTNQIAAGLPTRDSAKTFFLSI